MITPIWSSRPMPVTPAPIWRGIFQPEKNTEVEIEVTNKEGKVDADEMIEYCKENYKKEAAGSVAVVVEHYQEMTKKLKSGSKVLVPAGTHGGQMEFLLQQALVKRDKDGREKIGLDSIGEIGGEFNPTDSYNLDIKTDKIKIHDQSIFL